MPSGVWKLTRALGRVVAFALLLAVAGLLSAADAQAAPTDHHGAHHAAMDHAAMDHAAMDHAAAEATPVPADDGPHHGDHCHCISAVCAPLLQTQQVELTGFRTLVRHDRPGAMDARDLADPHPPSEPPRA